MTKTEAPRCYFCKAQATHLKLDSMPESTEGANGQILEDVIATQELPICLPCEEWNYDGTEIHPGVRSL